MKGEEEREGSEGKGKEREGKVKKRWKGEEQTSRKPGKRKRRISTHAFTCNNTKHTLYMCVVCAWFVDEIP